VIRQVVTNDVDSAESTDVINTVFKSLM